jgi:hypothetical protein
MSAPSELLPAHEQLVGAVGVQVLGGLDLVDPFEPLHEHALRLGRTVPAKREAEDRLGRTTAHDERRDPVSVSLTKPRGVLGDTPTTSGSVGRCRDGPVRALDLEALALLVHDPDLIASRIAVLREQLDRPRGIGAERELLHSRLARRRARLPHEHHRRLPHARASAARAAPARSPRPAGRRQARARTAERARRATTGPRAIDS